MPERGKNLGSFPSLTALKVEEVILDSNMYLSCKKSGEGTWKVPCVSLNLLALKTGTEGGDCFGT